VWRAVSQTGFVPAQVAFDVQDTHVPAPISQAGFGVTQDVALLSEHSPQAPLAWQAGVAPPQSPSPPHARQACSVPSHTGVVPEHSLLETQATQSPEGTWQTGVVPPQRVAFVTEHWPHAPPGWQAGVMPPHSLSPLQARHAWKAGSQTGVAPEQSASARQATHVPLVV
jgi:hypothetical protein